MNKPRILSPADITELFLALTTSGTAKTQDLQGFYQVRDGRAPGKLTGSSMYALRTYMMYLGRVLFSRLVSESKGIFFLQRCSVLKRVLPACENQLPLCRKF